jgi:hypothetical protein
LSRLVGVSTMSWSETARGRGHWSFGSGTIGRTTCVGWRRSRWIVFCATRTSRYSGSPRVRAPRGRPAAGRPGTSRWRLPCRSRTTRIGVVVPGRTLSIEQPPATPTRGSTWAPTRWARGCTSGRPRPSDPAKCRTSTSPFEPYRTMLLSIESHSEPPSSSTFRIRASTDRRP